ncbi:MAG: DUF2505 family protein [Leptospirales bacterium]|nr:DUF2505 family protein [Leptospirales bacterium]
MRKISIQQDFPHALAMLLDAREERYKRLDKFPELKNVHIVSESRHGRILDQKREISIADSMPAVIATLLPAGADVLVEVSQFDEDSHVHTFTVTPGGANDHIFRIKGVSRYYESGAGESARSYDIEIHSDAFLVGPLIENAIADVYARNLERDRRSILNFIQLLNEEQGAPSGPADDQRPADGVAADEHAHGN